jgi:hypothetical protein
MAGLDPAIHDFDFSFTSIRLIVPEFSYEYATIRPQYGLLPVHDHLSPVPSQYNPPGRR